MSLPITPDSATPRPRGAVPVTRRSVARGALWAAPVIAVAATVPAYAASGPPPVIVPGTVCKLPGASCNPLVKGYLFQLTMQNVSTENIWIYTGGTYGPLITDNSPVYQFTYEKASVNGVIYNPGQMIPVPAGATVTVLLNAGENSSSADLSGIIITTTFQWGHTIDPTLDTDHVNNPVTAIINVDASPPCVNCTI